MHLYYRNINDAFTHICRGFFTGVFACDLPYQYASSDRGGLDYIEYCISTHREPSRYGSVIRIQEPVTITYLNPLERVLFNAARDCNPFFHLIEALWMLAGQNKVQPLDYFAKKIAEFSDDDLTSGDFPFRGRPSSTTDMTTGYLWGAYGYRWRNWFKWDQLESCIAILKEHRQTRRVVLQMWCAEDLQRVQMDPTCKDVPCNLLVLFMPRMGSDMDVYHAGQAPSPRERLEPTGYGKMRRVNEDEGHASAAQILDMTVINRSNDTLWGALGSNYVHFSVLLEYVASACGMAPGHYHQVSNNLHIYTTEPTGTIATNSQFTERWSGKWIPGELTEDFSQPYGRGYRHYPLFRCPFNDMETTDLHRNLFDRAIYAMFNETSCIYRPYDTPVTGNASVPFIIDVVQPLLKTWKCYKDRNFNQAMREVNGIDPADWRVVCEQWLQRRANKHQDPTIDPTPHNR